MHCFVCGKDAVYETNDRRYLCRKHFTSWVQKKVFSYMRGRIKKKQRLVVAVSGGKDSAVLLHSLVELRKKFPINLLAITVDEGTNYRTKLIKCARELCKMLEVKHLILSFKDIVGKRLDELVIEDIKACTLCAIIRRRLLDVAAALTNGKIAVGHNLDDVAQAVLMNLFRNEPQRLKRMFFPITTSKMPGRIRPLMWIDEKATLTYAFLHELPFIHKKSPYSHKDVIRTQARELLQQMNLALPSAKSGLVKSALTLSKDLTLTHKENRCERCGHWTSGRICKVCELVEKFDLEKPMRWEEKIAVRLNEVG